MRDSAKFEHMPGFAATPYPRQADRDMGSRGPPGDKVLATAPHPLETTTIQMVNDAHARENRWHGPTMQRHRRVARTIRAARPCSSIQIRRMHAAGQVRHE
ncbi:MAG: hypothetical protein QM682_15655 [Paracoccus sp. (in: a-proteobacteria)]|uniref:hypothetical protein n=1 Tax=Paracoccus sp. TaxID=267 RepID=UPI0039E532D9